MKPKYLRTSRRSKLSTVIFAGVVASASPAFAVDGNWNVDNTGTWSSPGNWTAGVPGGIGSTVGLTNNISTATRTVTIDTTSRTVGILNIGDSDDTNSFILAASGGASLIFDNGASNAQLNVTGSVTDTISAPITLNSHLDLSNVGILTLSGNIGGSGGITKTGAGSLILNSGSKTFDGDFTLGGGTVDVGNNSSALGGGLFTMANATTISVGTLALGTDISNDLKFNAGTVSVLRTGGGGTGKVNYNGNLELGGNVVYAVGNNTHVVESTFNGDISDGVADYSLQFRGDQAGNRFTLAGDNTFSGGVSLFTNAAARLNINSQTALGTGKFTIFSGSIDNTSAGAITLSTNNTQDWNGNFTFVGSDNLNLGTGAVTMSTTRTVTVSAKTLTVGGAIGGSFSGYGLTKAGAGTLALTSSNSGYTGATTIAAGVLEVTKLANGGAGNFSSIGVSSNDQANLSMQNGSTLRYVGAGDNTDRRIRFGSSFADHNITLDASGIGAINFTNTANIGSFVGNQTRILNLTGTNTGANTLRFNLADNGTGALTVNKGGDGKWVLSGISNYTGATTVNQGTLEIAAGGSLATGSAVTVNNSASLVINGTINGALLANSSTTVSGTGTVMGSANIMGIHNPGNSPGIQTYGSDLSYTGDASVVNWELTGNTTTNAPNPNAIFDQVIVGGGLSFDLTTLNLLFNGTGSSVLWSDTLWDSTQSWTVYDVAGTTSGFDNLTLITANWLDSGGNAFDTVRSGYGFSLGQNGQDVVLNYSAIPEPSTALLGALGVLALLRRRR